MVLNNKAQMFSIWFPQDFFYPEVEEVWTPIIRRLKLPYRTLTDFMNGQIQKVSYPNIDIPIAEQGQSQFPIEYTTGKELEPLWNKDLTITFKLTESYYTYWVIYDQIKWFLSYNKKYKPADRVFMDDIFISFLSDAGLAMVNFRYKFIIPKSLGSFNLSYAAQASQYTSFDWTVHFNRMDVELESNKNNYV